MAELTQLTHLPGSLDQLGIQGLVEDNVPQLETGVNSRVTQGYDTLPRHMAEGIEVKLGFTVKEVAYGPDGVKVTSAAGETLEARAGVSTLPVGVLQANTVKFTPELPESKKDALKKIHMGAVVKVLLKFKEPFWPKSMSIVVSSEGPVTLYWNIFYGMDRSKVSPVLTAYTTGPRGEHMASISEEEAVKLSLDDLKRLFPKADPHGLFVESRRINWPKDPFAMGGYTLVLPGGTGARKQLAAADTGALFWAGSCVATTTISATVQGAYITGQQAAKDVLGLIRPS
jgi:monoamine oxidase